MAAHRNRHKVVEPGNSWATTLQVMAAERALLLLPFPRRSHCPGSQNKDQRRRKRLIPAAHPLPGSLCMLLSLAGWGFTPHTSTVFLLLFPQDPSLSLSLVI